MFYLRVDKYTLYDDIASEMGWKPTTVRQWKNVCLCWAKLSRIVNKRVALWIASKSIGPCKHWVSSVSGFLVTNNLPEYTDICVSIISSARFVQVIDDRVFDNFFIH